MTMFDQMADEVFGVKEKPRRVSLKDWRVRLHTKQGGKCMYCGIKLRIGSGHVDVKRPVSNGDGESSNNMQLLCGPCNTRKGALTDRQFRSRFKSVLPATLPPSRPIPLSRFEAVAKTVATKRAKAAKKPT